jgi:ribosomal protein S18 acetylase RimI-like enzyme
MQPYNDPKETVASAVDYALSTHPTGKGFLIVASVARQIVGVVVAVRTDRLEIIPENVLVYICVHPDHRHRGIGTRLLREALNCVDGQITVHLLRSNPAIGFLKKMGFNDDYYELRFEKGA